MASKTKPKNRLENHHYQAIQLLLSGESPESVAEKIGVVPRTIYNWLKGEQFKREYDFYRRQIFESAISRNVKITRDAIETLHKIAQDGQAPYPARVNAASKIADISLKHAEKDLEHRLEQVELQLNGESEQG